MKLTVRSSRIALAGTALAVTFVAGAAQAQRAAMVSQGKEMAAFFDGPRCAEEVKLHIKGRDVKYFESDRPLAAGLIHGLSLVIRGQCATLNRIRAKGTIQNRIVYTGFANASSDWLIVERGVSKSSGALSGGRKEGAQKGEKQKFRALANFIPFPDLLAQANNKAFMCARFDAATKTCGSVSDMSKLSPAGGTLVATSLASGPGDPTVVFTDTTYVSDGFLCANPQKSHVQVTGGHMTPPDRASFEDSFRERAADKGSELCVGYLNEGGKILSEYFDKEDYSVTGRSAVDLFATAPALRIDE